MAASRRASICSELTASPVIWRGKILRRFLIKWAVWAAVGKPGSTGAVSDEDEPLASAALFTSGTIQPDVFSSAGGFIQPKETLLASIIENLKGLGSFPVTFKGILSS